MTTTAPLVYRNQPQQFENIGVLPVGYSTNGFAPDIADIQVFRAEVQMAINNNPLLNAPSGQTILNALANNGAQIVLATSPGTLWATVPTEVQGSVLATTLGHTSTIFKNTAAGPANNQIADTVLHELGHMLDDLLGETVINPVTQKPEPQANLHDDPTFLSILRNDLELAQSTDPTLIDDLFNTGMIKIENGVVKLHEEFAPLLLSSKVGALNAPTAYAHSSISRLLAAMPNASKYLFRRLDIALASGKWGRFTKDQRAPEYVKHSQVYRPVSYGGFGTPNYSRPNGPTIIINENSGTEGPGGKGGTLITEPTVRGDVHFNDKLSSLAFPSLSNMPDDYSASAMTASISSTMARISHGFNISAQQPSFDPLIIDILGDGIQLSDPAKGIFIQENSADSFAFQTSWLAPGRDDGVLFFDEANDDTLKFTSQLFGNSFVKPGNALATDGFDALSTLDSNTDGVINSSDDDFDKIKILTAAGEVFSLEDLEITDISLGTSAVNELDEFGNEIVKSSSFTRNDSSVGLIADFNLLSNKTFSAAWYEIEETTEVQVLPDIQGFGLVYSLHQSMLRDDTGVLKGLVQQFELATDQSEQHSIVEQIIFQWTGVAGIAENFYGPHVNARAVAALSKLTGESVEIELNGTQSVGVVQADRFMSLFNELTDLVYGQLTAQTELNGLFDLISFDEDTQLFDLSAVKEAIADAIDLNETAGTTLLAKFHRAFTGIGLDQVANYHEFYATFAAMDPEYAWLMDSSGYETVIGSNGSGLVLSRVNDGEARAVALKAGTGGQSLFSSGQSVLYGNTGNDSIYAGYVKDLINAGAGDDSIYLRGGESTLIFNRGDGQDQVFEYFPVGLGMTDNIADHDILNFGAEIALEDLVFNPISNDLVIRIADTDDSIRLVGVLGDLFKKVTEFNFADGSSISLDDIIENYLSLDMPEEGSFVAPNLNLTINGNDDNATIIGGSGDKRIFSGSGDKEITTGNGQNIVVLEDGDNIVHLGDGVQHVILGTGNATINGGELSNSYYFDLDSGDASITRAGGLDTIYFGDDIELNDLTWSYSGSDIQINVAGASGSIVLKEQLADTTDELSLIFSEGDEILVNWEDILAEMAYVGTDGNNTINHSTETADEIINGLGGNDTITAGSGNDTIVITKGDQTVNAGEGNNVYIFSPGNGEAIIDESSGVNAPGESDTLIFTQGIYQSGTYFTASGNDLIITFKGSSDQITILGELLSSPTRVIDTFKFSTGVELSLNDIVTASFNPAAQDQFVYKASTENDSFDFALNDGLVRIIDGRSGNENGENDTLDFGAGIGRNDLLLSSSGSSYDLTIKIDGTNDAVTITNELLTGDLKRVGLFTFAVDDDLTLAQLLDTHVVDVTSTIDNDYVDRRLSFANENIETTGENATIYAGSGDNTITDDDGDATIVAGIGDSVIDAGAGTNIIDLTNDGDATVILGEGDTTVYDGAGNTTYQANLGSGNSVIYQHTSSETVGNAVIDFGTGIELNDLTLQSFGYDLVINITGGQSITLIGGLSSHLAKNINEFNFVDTSSYTLSQLLAELPLEVVVTNDNWLEDRHFTFSDETISLLGSQNRLNVGSGDVVVNVEGTNNRVFGGSNDNQINIEEGALDTFVNVGGGSTNIHIEKGTGHTVVAEFLPANFVGNNDHITLGTGIDDNDIVVTAKGQDITLAFNNTEEDQLTLQNALNPYQAKQIIDITFADSTVMDLEDILNLGVTFYEEDDFRTIGDKNWEFDKTVNASGDYQKINLGEGTDVLNVTGKNATVYGGAGEATVNFEDGMGSVNFYEHEVSDNNDVVSFGGELDLDDVRLTYTDSGDLILWFDGTNDIINFRDQFDSAQKEIEQFTFNNGAEVLSRSELFERTFYFTMEGDNATMYHTYDFNEEIVVNSNNAMLNLFGEGGSYDITVNGESAWLQLYGSESTITINGADAEIYAGGPSTTFVLNEGFGNLLIDEDISGASPGIDDDHIIFGEGFDVEDMILSYDQSGAVLLISFEGSTDQLRIAQQMYSSPFKVVEDFTFADSTVLTFADILAEGVFYFTYDVDDDGDSHFGTLNENVTLNGNNNHFYAADGTNTITINGDDGWVELGDGNSTVIVNGADAEIYTGMSGEQTFVINPGTGNVFISETYGGSGALPNDHLVFGGDITLEDLALSYINSTDLVISIIGTNDTVTIDEQVSGSAKKRVGDFTFSDLSVLTYEDLLEEGTFYFTYDADDDADSHFGTLNENVTINGNNDSFNAGDGINTITINGDDAWVELGDGDSTVTVNGANAELQVGIYGEYTFVVNPGAGNVLIHENYGGSGALPNDHLVFGGDITFDDIYLTYVNSTDLVIGVIGTNDTVTIDEQVSGSAKKRVGDFTFGASTMSYNDLLANGRFYFYVNADNDGLNHFGSTNEYIELNGFNDMLWDNDGDNIIVINGDSAGIDLGYGEKKVIVNGADAEIWVGYGSTTFELNPGFGNLVIENVSNNTYSEEDHIIFGEGIEAEDLHFTFDYNDLFVTFDGSSDVLEVEMQMYSISKKIVDFTFADESVLTWADVLEAGFEFNRTANNGNFNQTNSLFNANITSTGTNDSLTLGNARNIVNISGDSAYIYGGNDQLIIEASGNNNEYNFNWSTNGGLTSTGNNGLIYNGHGTNTYNLSGANDTIYGGQGKATINLSSGIGTLNVYEQNSPDVSGTRDLIYFDETFDKEDMWVSYVSGSWDLLVGFDGMTDLINIHGQVNGSPNKYVDFEFADSTTYDINDILDMSFRFNSSANGEYYSHTYTSVDETFNLSGHNDTVLLGAHTNEVNISGNNATIYSNGTDEINMDGANATIYGGARHADINLTAGFGTLNVYEYTSPAVSGTVDTLYFDSTFDSADMWVSYNQWSWDLLVGFIGSNDIVNVHGQVSSSPTKKVEIEFSDSTLYDWTEIKAMRYRFASDANNAYLDHSIATGDELFVYSGDNATVYTGSGDTIVELSGDHSDGYAYYGTSTFNVSGTNDIIYGTNNGTSATVNFNAGGNIFYSGTKKSIININADHGTFALHQDAYKSSSGDKDEVHFDDDVEASDVAFFMSGNDLLLSYNDNSDIVTIYKQNQSNYQAGKLVLDDGSYLTAADINQVITDMSSYASTNSISFTSLSDVQNSSALMNIIANAWQAA